MARSGDSLTKAAEQVGGVYGDVEGILQESLRGALTVELSSLGSL
jgi:hypothetical protein